MLILLGEAVGSMGMPTAGDQKNKTDTVETGGYSDIKLLFKAFIDACKYWQQMRTEQRVEGVLSPVTLMFNAEDVLKVSNQKHSTITQCRRVHQMKVGSCIWQVSQFEGFS
jgi:hypothetical protein